MSERIGDRIKRLRKDKKLTQAQLGEFCHVKQATISSWEMNRTEPNMGNIADLCKILEVGSEYLAYGELAQIAPTISDPVKSRALAYAKRLQRLTAEKQEIVFDLIDKMENL